MRRFDSVGFSSSTGQHQNTAAEKGKSRAPHWITIDPAGSANVARAGLDPKLPGDADKERAKSKTHFFERKTHVFKLWVEPRT